MEEVSIIGLDLAKNVFQGARSDGSLRTTGLGRSASWPSQMAEVAVSAQGEGDAGRLGERVNSTRC